MNAPAWTRICTPAELMKEVVHCAGFVERFDTLASHPYNQDKPDQSVWWLFPRSRTPYGKWPAYSIGKYFFDRPPGRGVMRLGLHVEKGIAPGNAASFGNGKGANLGMKPDWDWFRLVEDLKSGRMGEALAEVRQRAQMPAEFSIVTEFPVDERVVYDQFGEHRFEVAGDGALKLVYERVAPKKLIGIGAMRTLRELGERFARATDEETWTWINVHVGCAIAFHADPPHGAGPAWNGSDFWNNVLEPLAGWVK